MEKENGVPDGLCGCGCGQQTRRAPYTSARVGWVKGEWTRFILGHNLKTTPRYAVEEATGCWITLGGKTKLGYGKITENRRTILLHRWMYEKHVGPIPPGKHVHHACANKSCCNPHHLRVLTPEEHKRTHVLPALTEQDRRDMRLLGSLGVVNPRIAARYGVSTEYVRRLMRAQGKARKMTEQDMRDMRLLASFGVTHTRIAAHFGVSAWYIAKLLSGQRGKEG